MENILQVVEERDKAVSEVERGAWVGPRVVDGVDKLGRPVSRLEEEHLEPQTPNDADDLIWSDWTLRYLRAEREQKIREKREEARKEKYETESQRRRRIDRISANDFFEALTK